MACNGTRGLPEQLAGPELVKKFPAFYGTRRFIAAFTTARHLSLSWARSIQSHIPFPLLRSYQRISPVPRLLWPVRNTVKFLWWGVVSTSPKPLAGGPPLVGSPRLFIQYIRRYPPHLQAVPPSATWGRAMPWWQGATYTFVSSGNGHRSWRRVGRCKYDKGIVFKVNELQYMNCFSHVNGSSFGGWGGGCGEIFLDRCKYKRSRPCENHEGV